LGRSIGFGKNLFYCKKFNNENITINLNILNVKFQSTSLMKKLEFHEANHLGKVNYEEVLARIKSLVI